MCENSHRLCEETAMSEKKQPEAELHSVRYPHYDFQDMMMHAPIGIFSSTPDGRFVYVNMALA